MRWPWVSRAQLDAAHQRANDAVADYNRAVAERNDIDQGAHERYEALLAKYHALRMAGAEPVEPKPVPHPVADEFAQPIETAIIVAADGNRQLERHLRGRARLRMARGEQPDDIARKIEQGDGSDE